MKHTPIADNLKIDQPRMIPWARKPILIMHNQIRKQLEPIIREAGVGETAKRAGLAQPNLSRWLRGDYNYNLDVLKRVAQACGCRLTVNVKTPSGKERQYK